MQVTVLINQLDERRFDPPRTVAVEPEGQWCRGFQARWLLYDDRRGCMVQVEYTARYEHGAGKHLATVGPGRMRVREDHRER